MASRIIPHSVTDSKSNLSQDNVPEIFDRPLLRLRRDRASRRHPSFLMERVVDDATDRLCDVNRRFEKALFIGPSYGLERLKSALPADKQPKHWDQFDDFTSVSSSNLRQAPYDTIISCLRLQSVNDLPGALGELRQILKPDGLCMAAMFGGQTLRELRQACYETDDNILGGLTARVYPFADYSQAAALLQRTGFALPVVDMDKVNVSYGQIHRLISDLRDLGDTNCLTQRVQKYLGKEYVKQLNQTYLDNFSTNGKLNATFEIIWMTGWAPHDSQQKPLRPGSAKMRLADALGSREQKL